MSSRKRPPGPHIARLACELPEIVRNPLTFIRRMLSTYGETVLLDGWVRSYYVVSHPADIQRVMQTNQLNYGKLTAFESILGAGLSVSEGAPWQRQRRRIQGAFDPSRLEVLSSLMTDATCDMAKRWDNLPDGATVDVSSEMMKLALDITGRTMFGSGLAEEADELGSSLDLVQRHLQRRFFIYGFVPEWLFSRQKRCFDEAVAKIDRIVYRLIENRRRSREKHSDLLSLLLETDEAGEVMTDEMVRDNVLILLLGGYETTATALTWTWYLLSRRADVRLQLERELGSVLAGAEPCFADVSRLTYARMVVAESLRLFPPAWVIPRRVKESDELGGYQVPAGATVLIAVYSTHRNPAWWDAPDEFRPERFLPTLPMSRPSHAYVPFGGGPRKCTGYAFAMLEMTLVLATIVQRYRLEVIDSDRVEPEPLLVLRPRENVRARLKRRRSGGSRQEAVG